KLDSVVTLDIDNRYQDLSIDTSAGILTNGLLGESYVGLQPGGDPESLKPGEEIAFTTPSVDIIQMVGKYMFSGGGDNAAAAPGALNRAKESESPRHRPTSSRWSASTCSAAAATMPRPHPAMPAPHPPPRRNPPSHEPQAHHPPRRRRAAGRDPGPGAGPGRS